jgi:cell wall-associated NlpC family hydrolase
VIVGAHSAVRKSAKTWLVPAVGTAVAVTGQGLVAVSSADASPVQVSAATSGLTAGADLSIAPKLQPETASFAALAREFKSSKLRTPRLTQGMHRSGYVLYVQKKLGVLPWSAKLGKTTGAGYFGPQTRAAVLRFQKEKGIDAVGSVGPKTWKALLAVGPGKVHKFHKAKAKAKATSRSTSRASRSSSRTPVKHVSGSRTTKVLALAASQQGRRYVWGGTGTSGFDCSGFVGWVYRQAGVSLPRTSRQIYSAVDHISKSSARPGDLFFVRNSSGSIYHVGIIGTGGKWWEARNPHYGVGKFDPWTSGSSVLYGRV